MMLEWICRVAGFFISLKLWGELPNGGKEEVGKGKRLKVELMEIGEIGE
jgi:hypothetical protein